MNIEILVDRFRQHYGHADLSGGRHLAEEYTYKYDRGQEMRAWLSEEQLNELVTHGNYQEICQRAVRSFQMPGGLARWDEYQWVRDLNEEEQGQFATGLIHYLYGEAPFQERFSRFVQEATATYRHLKARDLAATDRYARGTLTWPFVSYIHFMMWPEELKYPFLKPRFLRGAARAAGVELQYSSSPNVTTYVRAQEFYQALWPRVKALNGRDWIDVQTMIHVAGGGFGVPEGGWIDQQGSGDAANGWRAELVIWLRDNSRRMSRQLLQLRQAFLDHFPKEQLAEIALEEYALGHEKSKDSFCYWIERKTEELGSIRGGTSAKFGIWWSQAEQQWRWNKVLEAKTAEEAWHKIREGLVRMVEAVEAADLEHLDEIGARALGSNRYSLRSKPLSLYYPDYFLPISSPGHLAHFLECFGLKPEGDLHARNLQLLDFLRDQDEFEGFDTLQMSKFLYDTWEPREPTPEPEDDEEDKEGTDELIPPSLLQIQAHIATSDLVFDPQSIANYHLSVLTKPFVILTGLSGTGKTQLTRLYAEAVYDIASGQPNPHYQLIAVRPDWNDHRGLLGYYNPLTETYDATPFLRFLLRAACDLSHWYYVCLDEMNLARVEYYFSDFLSVLEAQDLLQLHPFAGECVPTRSGDGITGGLPEATAAESSYQVNGVLYVPAAIPIPANLVVTGTVNVDETTHAFSDKVLDRANSIEFSQVSIDTYLRRYVQNHPDRAEMANGVMPILVKVYEMLEPHYLHFGYRTLKEILAYLWHNETLSANTRLPQATALDNQLMQKLLPKLRGDERIQTALEQLRDYLIQELGEGSKSVRKLAWMLEELNTYGSTHFWR